MHLRLDTIILRESFKFLKIKYYQKVDVSPIILGDEIDIKSFGSSK